jgi:hypothetical protein
MKPVEKSVRTPSVKPTPETHPTMFRTTDFDTDLDEPLSPTDAERRADKYRLAWLSARRRATLAAFGYASSPHPEPQRMTPGPINTHHPATTAHILIRVAAYLDVIDMHHGSVDHEVQDDLQSIAKWLTDHPDIDQQIYAAVEAP